MTAAGGGTSTSGTTRADSPALVVVLLLASLGVVVATRASWMVAFAPGCSTNCPNIQIYGGFWADVAMALGVAVAVVAVITLVKRLAAPIRLLTILGVALIVCSSIALSESMTNRPSLLGKFESNWRPGTGAVLTIVLSLVILGVAGLLHSSRGVMDVQGERRFRLSDVVRKIWR